MTRDTINNSVNKAGDRLAQLTMTMSPPSMGSTPEAREKEARREIEDRLRKDPGLPADSPTMSYWQDPEHPFAHSRSNTLPQGADVVIIGSGITSISTAQHLLRLEPQLKIIILEARAAISGATGRNGGHIKASPWGDYSGLKALFGKESGMKIMKFRMAHLDAFCQEAALLGEAGKPGLVRRTQSLSTSYDLKAWEGSKACLTEFLEDFPQERGKWTAIEDRVELKNLGLSQEACGTIRGPEGAAWPYRFVGAVLKKLLNEGQVTLETHTPVTAVERSSSFTHPYRVQTTRGSISAKHVIHCTNGFAAHLLPALRGKLWPFRGQMTVQSVPPQFPRLGAERSWSAIYRQGFDYITQSAGPDGCLYWGGGFLQKGSGIPSEEDNLAVQAQDLGCSDDSQLSLPCLERLETAAGRALEHGKEAQIVRKWTGIMGCTGDGLPLVGRLTKQWSTREDCDPRVGGEWIAAGFNGFGMVNCWLTGKGLAHLVTGREDQARPWFPIDEFACKKERLDGMSPEGSISLFLDRLETW